MKARYVFFMVVPWLWMALVAQTIGAQQQIEQIDRTFEADSLAQFDTEEQIDEAVAEVKTYYLQDTDKALEQLEKIRRSSEKLGYSEGIVEYLALATELSQTVGGEDRLLAYLEALDFETDERFRENPDLFHRLLLSKAILFSNIQKKDESLEIFTMLERESDDPFILAVVYGTMGAIYSQTGEYDKALDNTLKSIDYFKKENNTKNYVFGLTSIADILTVNDRHQEAVKSQILCKNRIG